MWVVVGAGKKIERNINLVNDTKYLRNQRTIVQILEMLEMDRYCRRQSNFTLALFNNKSRDNFMKCSFHWHFVLKF